jgi:hypothetical protein
MPSSQTVRYADAHIPYLRMHGVFTYSPAATWIILPPNPDTEKWCLGQRRKRDAARMAELFYLYVCTYVSTYVCMHACMYACVHTWKHSEKENVSLCTWECIYVWVHVTHSIWWHERQRLARTISICVRKYMYWFVYGCSCACVYLGIPPTNKYREGRTHLLAGAPKE